MSNLNNSDFSIFDEEIVINDIKDLKDLFNGSVSDEDEDDDAPVNEWIYQDGAWSPSFNSKKADKLPGGCYTVDQVQGKYFVDDRPLNLDKIYEMPDGYSRKILDEIDKFWKKEALYKQHGLVHKRGILLSGPPGTGKSSTINLLAKSVIEKEGLVFYVSTIRDLDILVTFVKSKLRKIQPSTPIIVVLEDVDELKAQASGFILSFLDGENQLDNCVTIATTNRVEELDDLILRPSRFDWHISVDQPNEECRRLYFKKTGVTPENIEEYVERTAGLSMAHLKEVFIATHLLDYELEDVINKLSEQDGMIQKWASTPKSKTIGFSSK